MNFTKYAKMAVVMSFAMAALWGHAPLAHAEGDGTRDGNGGGGDIVVFDINGVTNSPTRTATDDVVVDGNIITAENYDAAAASGDPEWRYVPVRRTGG